MPNILEDLYYGNLSPCQRAIRPGNKVQKLMQKQSDIESKLSLTVSTMSVIGSATVVTTKDRR